MITLDFSKLNKDQLEAVQTLDGPVVITASAGAGKTHTVTYRLANLINSGVAPENILMLTFTVKAGREMRDRAIKLIGPSAGRITVGTYHSFCSQILHKFGYLINIKPDFAVLSSSNCEDLVQHILEGYNLPKDDKRAYPSAKIILEALSAAINKRKRIDNIISVRHPVYLPEMELINRAVMDYKKYKVQNNVMDFDDMLTYTISILKNNPSFCERMSDKYKYIMVDEYQDSNNLQMELVGLLRQFSNKNLCVVGDAGQSIYFWRSANYQNILNFTNMYPGAKEISLHQNYRSNQEILDLANAVLNASSIHYNEPMVGQYKKGEQPKLVLLPNEFEEADYIVGEIKRQLSHGTKPNDIAVLQRNGNNSVQLEAKLNIAGIKYKKYGGQKFMDHADCQNIIALLQIVNGSSVDIFWYRILKLLPGIGSAAAERLTNLVRNYGVDALLLDPKIKKPETVHALDDFVGRFRNTRTLKSTSDIVRFVINDFYKEMMDEILKNSTAKNSLNRWQTFINVIEQIQFLIDVAKDYQSVGALLEDITLDADDKNAEEECLVISTVHSAKGLEWETVFVMQVTDKCYPSAREPSSAEEEAWDEYFEEIEESRRLLYVAITRAKNDLFLTFPLEKTYYGKKETQELSRFLAVDDIYEKWCSVDDRSAPESFDPDDFLWY